MTLGPILRKRFGVPYLLDFQDPWLNDYYGRAGSPAPPGGRVKYGVARLLAHIFEPYVLRHAAAAVSVSPEYPEILKKRYPALNKNNFFVLPFGAAKEDFSLLAKFGVKQRVFDPHDGRTHWVYVGRGGGDMTFALRSFFMALHQARASHPVKYNNVSLHFIGTDYTPGMSGKKTIEPVAAECGVGDMVMEIPGRITYFEALKCLQDADVLIVPGSNDPGYTASKIYPYILAQKPLLAIFHEQSSVVDVIHSTRAGVVVTFKSDDTFETVSGRITETWFKQYPPGLYSPDWNSFEKYTAREMAGKLCKIFNYASQGSQVSLE